jgi:hypothetical protein
MVYTIIIISDYSNILLYYYDMIITISSYSVTYCCDVANSSEVQSTPPIMIAATRRQHG